MVCGAGRRTTIWLVWFFNTATNVVFVLLGLSVHRDLQDTYENHANTHAQSLLNGLIVSSVFALVLVALYSIFVPIVLMKKTIAKSGAGFSYGMIVTQSFWTAFHLANIVAHFWSFISWLEGFGDAVELNEIRATVGLGAVSTVSMLVLGTMLALWRDVVSGPGPVDPPSPRRTTNNPLSNMENSEETSDNPYA